MHLLLNPALNGLSFDLLRAKLRPLTDTVLVDVSAGGLLARHGVEGLGQGCVGFGASWT